jgi:hypothetical protein
VVLLFGNVLEEQHSFEQIFQPFLKFEGILGCHLWCMEVPFEHCSSKQKRIDGDLPFTKVSLKASPPRYINNLDNGKIK